MNCIGVKASQIRDGVCGCVLRVCSAGSPVVEVSTFEPGISRLCGLDASARLIRMDQFIYNLGLVLCDSTVCATT